MSINGVIFDFDGTLVNTISVGLPIYQETILKFSGKHVELDEIKSWFGPSDQGVLQRAFPDLPDEVYSYYVNRHREECDPSIVFEGIRDGLERLSQQGVNMAIVTGRARETYDLLMELSGLAHYFSHAEVGHPSGNIKEECINRVKADWQIPDQDLIYVGDFPSDMINARQVGIAGVAVSWCPTADLKALVDQDPHAHFDRTEDFFNWVLDQ